MIGIRERHLLASGLLAIGIALPAGRVFSADTSSTSTPTTSTAKTAEEKKEGRHRERHPEIHKAIKQLEKAKDDLQHAAHDFGGHRVKAVQAIDQALQELHLALQFDKR